MKAAVAAEAGAGSPDLRGFLVPGFAVADRNPNEGCRSRTSADLPAASIAPAAGMVPREDFAARRQAPDILVRGEICRPVVKRSRHRRAGGEQQGGKDKPILHKGKTREAGNGSSAYSTRQEDGRWQTN